MIQFSGGGIVIDVRDVKNSPHDAISHCPEASLSNVREDRAAVSGAYSWRTKCWGRFKFSISERAKSDCSSDFEIYIGTKSDDSRVNICSNTTGRRDWWSLGSWYLLDFA